MSGTKSRQIVAWWVALLLLLVCSALSLGMSIYSTSNAQNNSTPTLTEHGVITLIAGEYFIDIVRIWETDEADGSEPDNDTYLILELIIHNASSSDACFYRGDFKLLLEDDETDPSDMDHVRDQHYEDWDYPGPFRGQCIDEGESVPSFVSFDVDLPLSEFRLRFKPDEEAIVLIWLEPLTNGEFNFGILSLEQGEAQLSTHTATPSITPTRTQSATLTLTATLTPPTTNTVGASLTRRPSSTPQPSGVTYYISGSGTVNARECPRTSCNIATTFSTGDTVSVILTVEGERTLGSNEWRGISYQGETVYVHSSLTSRTRPSTRVPVTQAPQSPPPVSTQPPGFACDCSKTCTQMVSCDEAYYQLNQCGCQQRDSDNDGVPCESICPGG